MRAKLLAVAMLAYGCSPITMSAPNTVNPVMLGPVRSFDGPEALDPKVASAPIGGVGRGDADSDEKYNTVKALNDFNILVMGRGNHRLRGVVDEVDCKAYVFLAIVLGPFFGAGVWRMDSRCGAEVSLHRTQRGTTPATQVAEPSSPDNPRATESRAPAANPYDDAGAPDASTLNQSQSL